MRRPAKPKKRTTTGKPKSRITPEQIREVVEGFQRRAAEHPDPPGTVVIEVQGDQESAVGADGISEAERASGIRLHQRLRGMEHMARALLANPETTPDRRWRAEVLLRETLDARARWATGERPDARMGDLERIVGTLRLLAMLPLAAKASKPSSPNADTITEALVGFARTERDAGPRALWPRLAARFGWEIVPEQDGAEERLSDAKGHVQITYSQFKKRLSRAKKKR